MLLRCFLSMLLTIYNTQAASGPEEGGGLVGAAAKQGLAAAARQEAEGGALLVAALLRCMQPADAAHADANMQSRQAALLVPLPHIECKTQVCPRSTTLGAN